MTTGPKRYKLCTACGESKPIEDFYRRKTGALERWCKPCNIADVARRKAEKRRIAREARLALPAPTERTCRKCETVRPLSEFYTDPAGRVRTECDDCRREYLQEWKSRPGTRASQSAKGKTYAQANQHRARVRRLAKYGLTPEQYDAMYDQQGGRCWICKTVRERVGSGETGGGNVLCVDHHHGNGAVRGLLCSACNRAIGLLGDDIGRLEAAIAYLTSGERNGS